MADIEDEADIPAILLPCTTCNRTFKPQSLDKHTKVCAKTATKKRRTFDSSKQRIQGTELAEFLPTLALLNKKEKPVKKVPSKWKERHMELVRAVRAARGIEVTPRPSGSVTKLCDHEKCPHCDRQFGPKAYDRHIEWCKEQKARIPKSPSSTKAKERLEARLKYRAPALMKSRPMLIRDKYSSAANLLKSGPASPVVPNQQTESQKTVVAEKTPNRPNEVVRSTAKPTLQRNASMSGPRSSMRQRSISPVKRVSSQTTKTASTAKSEAIPQVRKGKDTKMKDLVSPNTNSARQKVNTPVSTPHSSKSKNDDVQEKRNAASLKPPSPITRKLSNTTINSEGDATNPTLSLSERLRDSISVTNCVSHNSISADPSGINKSDLYGSPVSFIPTKFNLSKKVIQLNDVSVNAEMPEIKVSQISLCKPPSQLVTWKQMADMPDAQLLKQCANSDEESDCDCSNRINRSYTVDNLSIDSIETSNICKDGDRSELHFHVESAQGHSYSDKFDIEENHTVSSYTVSSDALCDREEPYENKIMEVSKSYENPEFPDSLETTKYVGRNEIKHNYSVKPLQEIVLGVEATKSYTLLDNDVDAFQAEEISDSSTPVKEEFFVEIPKIEFKNIGSDMRTNTNICRDSSSENAVFDTGNSTDSQETHDYTPNYGDHSLSVKEIGDNETQYGSIITNCLEEIEHCPNSEVICDIISSTDNNSLMNADKNNRDLKEEVHHHCSSEPEQCTESFVDFMRQTTGMQCENQNDARLNFHAFPLQSDTKDDLKVGSSSKRSKTVMSSKRHPKKKYNLETIFKCKKPKLKCKKMKSCTCEKSCKIYKHLVSDWKMNDISRNVWNFGLHNNHNYEFNFKIKRNKCKCDTDLESSPEKHYFLEEELEYRSNYMTRREDESSSTEECGFENCDGSGCEIYINKECGLTEVVMNNSYMDGDFHIDSDELSDTANIIVYNEECDCILEKSSCFSESKHGSVCSKFCDDFSTSYEYTYVGDEKCETDCISMDCVELAHSQAKDLLDSKSHITTFRENTVQNNNLGNDSKCVASVFCEIEPKALHNSLENGTYMSKTTIDHKTLKISKELSGEEIEQYMDSYKLKETEEMCLNLKTSNSLNDSCIAKEFTEKAEMNTDNSSLTQVGPLAGGCSILDEEVYHTTTVNEVPTIRSVTSKTDISEDEVEMGETAPYSAIENCNSASNKKRTTKSKTNNVIKLKIKKKQPNLVKTEKAVAKKLLPVPGNEKAIDVCDIQRNSILNSESDSNPEYLPSVMNSLASPTEFNEVKNARKTEISILHPLRDSDLHHQESLNSINHENNFSNKEFKLPAIVSNPEKEMSSNNLFPHHNNTVDEVSKLTVSQLPTYDDNKLNKSFLPDIGILAPLKTSSQCNELNAQCFTVLNETRGHEETHLLCVPSKIPRPLFNKQMDKTNSQVMKVHHLPSLDTSLVKFSSCEEIYSPYQSAEQQMQELLFGAMPHSRPTVHSAPSPSSSTQLPSAFAKYSPPPPSPPATSKWSSSLHELDEIFLAAESGNFLPPFCNLSDETSESTRGSTLSLCSLGIPFSENFMDAGKEKSRRMSKIRAKMESASLSLQQSVSLVNYDNEPKQQVDHVGNGFLSISEELDSPIQTEKPFIISNLKDTDSKSTNGNSSEHIIKENVMNNNNNKVLEELFTPIANNRYSTASKNSADSAYSSLSRRSPHQTMVDREGNDMDRYPTICSSGSESSLPPIGVGQREKTEDSMESTQQNASLSKLSKFCHECGSKYPVNLAKFCCECGVRRLFV